MTSIHFFIKLNTFFSLKSNHKGIFFVYKPIFLFFQQFSSTILMPAMPAPFSSWPQIFCRSDFLHFLAKVLAHQPPFLWGCDPPWPEAAGIESSVCLQRPGGGGDQSSYPHTGSKLRVCPHLDRLPTRTFWNRFSLQTTPFGQSLRAGSPTYCTVSVHFL